MKEGCVRRHISTRYAVRNVAGTMIGRILPRQDVSSRRDNLETVLIRRFVCFEELHLIRLRPFLDIPHILKICTSRNFLQVVHTAYVYKDQSLIET